MIDDHWNSISPIGTLTPGLVASVGAQVWCATREGYTLSCQIRAASPEESGWELVMKTGVDTTRPRWLTRWLRGEEPRDIDCRRESQKILFTRPCANEATARFIALALKHDYLQAGWLECC